MLMSLQLGSMADDAPPPIPPGSYQATCKNIKVSKVEVSGHFWGWELTAECSRKSVPSNLPGGHKTSWSFRKSEKYHGGRKSVTYLPPCEGDEIVNCDGNLACSKNCQK